LTIARIDYDLCVACGSCIELCPMDVLRANGDGSPAILYADDCQVCYLCELKCPTGALLVLPERASMPRHVYGVFDPRDRDAGLPIPSSKEAPNEE